MSNYGYSRRRPKSKGDITDPTERVHQDAVTGELVTTPLDGVQLAFEKVRRDYETAAHLFDLSGAERERLADMVILMVVKTKRHQDSDVEAIEDVLEWMNTAALRG